MGAMLFRLRSFDDLDIDLIICCKRVSACLSIFMKFDSVLAAWGSLNTLGAEVNSFVSFHLNSKKTHSSPNHKKCENLFKVIPPG